MEAPGLDSLVDGAGYIYWRNALFVIDPPPCPVEPICPAADSSGPPSHRFKAPCYWSSSPLQTFQQIFSNLSNRSQRDEIVLPPHAISYEDALSRPSPQLSSPPIIPRCL